MIESLENRRLLSVSVSASGGTLTITGDSKANSITVEEGVDTSLPGFVPGHVEVSVDNGATTQVFNGITAIKISGGGGGDRINFTGINVGADIRGDNANTTSQTGGSSGGTGGGSGGGGNGNDFITVSDNGTGSSTVNGDGGDDTITVLHGNNTAVFGGNGNDYIVLESGSTVADGGNGNDAFNIDGGMNTVNGGAGKDSVVINTSGGAVVADQVLISIEKTATF